MLLLVIVSLIWAFSFGLIRRYLGGVDSAFITLVRLGLALLVFLPFLRFRAFTWKSALVLLALGGVQFGVMYLAYNEGFKHLQAHEVALLTLTTPVFVTLLADAAERRFHPRSLLAALLAVAGTLVIVFQGKALAPTVLGVVLVQISNLAFAAGQIGYRRFRGKQTSYQDRELFAWLYAGGVIVALLALIGRDVSLQLATPQIVTLLYLGIVASGVGFFLWNIGATQVSGGTLAVMNNAKVPLAVACTLLFFGEQANLPRLLLSLGLMIAAVSVADRR